METCVLFQKKKKWKFVKMATELVVLVNLYGIYSEVTLELIVKNCYKYCHRPAGAPYAIDPWNDYCRYILPLAFINRTTVLYV